MGTLPEKLNYKGQPRIALLQSEESFTEIFRSENDKIIIDREIDPRCPYSFVMVFVKSILEVENIAPPIIHNLTADGVLWFCYPKKTSKRYKTDISRDNGWNALNDSGFYGIRMVALDEDWSALRFRNIKYIKSTSSRFPKNGL